MDLYTFPKQKSEHWTKIKKKILKFLYRKWFCFCITTYLRKYCQRPAKNYHVFRNGICKSC